MTDQPTPMPSAPREPSDPQESSDAREPAELPEVEPAPQAPDEGPTDDDPSSADVALEDTLTREEGSAAGAADDDSVPGVAPHVAPRRAEEPDAGRPPSDSPADPDTDRPGPSAPADPVDADADRPAPAPGPRPAVPSPAALAGRRPSTVPAPIASATAYDEEAVGAAKAFGRVAEDGTVVVHDGNQEREVGAYPDGTAEEALAFFARKYLDIVAFLDLFEQGTVAGNQTLTEVNKSLEQLRKHLKEPKVVGDIPALRARARALRERSKERIAELEQERTNAKQASAQRRAAFVEEIEQLVAADPATIHWKRTGDRIRDIVPEWKRMQKEDAPIDRATEDELWKRLSKARSTFDRNRRAWFSKLDEEHDEAKRLKEDLIARAEAMQHSTDWGPTVRAYKDLMGEWKRAPRGHRRTDDVQWSRFKAAQDTFFAARNADLEASESEQRENLTVKEQLLQEAEALLPVQDLPAAKAALLSIQDRWETAGRVPRSDLRRVEDRLRVVERAVKDREHDQWRRSDPETKARVEGAAGQLYSAIEQLEEELTTAERAGDTRRIEEARAALDTRREWLTIVERNARDLT